jgi:hypothetical protein
LQIKKVIPSLKIYIFEEWMTDSNQDVKEENTSLLHEDLEAL